MTEKDNKSTKLVYNFCLLIKIAGTVDEVFKWLLLVKCHLRESLKCIASAVPPFGCPLPHQSQEHCTLQRVHCQMFFSSNGRSFVLWRLTTNITNSEIMLTLNKTRNRSIIGVNYHILFMKSSKRTILSHLKMYPTRTFLNNLSLEIIFLYNFFLLSTPAYSALTVTFNRVQNWFGNSPGPATAHCGIY